MFEKEKIEEILNGLITRRVAVEKQLSQYPEGELKVRRQTKNGKEYTTFYLEMPKEPGKVRRERKTISRDTERLRIMARKQYLQTLLEQLDGNIAALQETIGILENTSTGAILSALDPVIQKEIVFQKQTEYRMPEDSEEAREHLEWIKAPYVKNPKNPEHLKHRTSTGELVRSKSEVLIYEKLKEYKMASRYDSALQAGNKVIYPDFTIRRTDGKIFYWEHAGRCDLQNYRKEILWKMKEYEKIGIGQWDNLILTFDVGDGMIDLREIESIIQMKLII